MKDLKDTLKSHMHRHHNLGKASTTGVYWQSWLQTARHADGKSSNNYLTNAGVPIAAKRAILRYRTGTLYNAKHAVRFGHQAGPATCPLCGGADGGTHILLGCQHPTMKKMYTERHNDAARHILKAVSKAQRGGFMVAADVGCSDKVPACLTDTPRTIPAWLGVRDARSRPDAVFVIPNDTYLGSEIDKVRPGEADVYVMELKYCPDTNPHDQLGRATAQHADICNQLEHLGHTVHRVIILLGAGGTIFTEHTRTVLQEWGIRGDQLAKLCNKLNNSAAHWAASIVGTRRHHEHTNRPQAMGQPALRRDPG